jgi:hypothetical protein
VYGYSVVVGGQCNSACNFSAVVGGKSNSISAYCSFIGGGFDNTITGDVNSSSIVGGICNTISAPCSFIGGGSFNNVCGIGSFIGGGCCNTASGCYAMIIGGHCNLVCNLSVHGTIGGGFCNSVRLNYGTIGGGYINTAFCQYSTIGGGFGNTACGPTSTVIGGQCNIASGCFSAAGGCAVSNSCNNTFMYNCLRACNLMGGANAICVDAGGIIIRVPSDVRLKTCISPITYGLSDILLLNPVSFSWCDNVKETLGENKQLGFIAQEVEPIIPESVGMSDEGEYSFSADKIVPVLTKAIQELKEDNDKLRVRIEILEEYMKSN